LILNSVFIHRINNEVMHLKVMADGMNWREIDIPITDLEDAGFWNKVEWRVALAPLTFREASTLECPVCKAHKSSFLREYEGRWFCGFCGSHLRYDGKALELIHSVV
jgi:ribosomal protein S27AE